MLFRGRGIEFGFGPLGQCEGPNCGKKQQPSIREPCYLMKCPECGSSMKKRQ